jgi:hypothetical protein
MKFIFEVRIKPGHTAEQYAAAWVRVSEILQRALRSHTVARSCISLR